MVNSIATRWLHFTRFKSVHYRLAFFLTLSASTQPNMSCVCFKVPCHPLNWAWSLSLKCTASKGFVLRQRKPLTDFHKLIPLRRWQPSWFCWKASKKKQKGLIFDITITWTKVAKAVYTSTQLEHQIYTEHDIGHCHSLEGHKQHNFSIVSILKVQYEESMVLHIAKFWMFCRQQTCTVQ